MPARPVDVFKAVIDAPSVQTQFKNALGTHKDAFVASLIDLYTGDKSLQKCKPAAVVAEALRAATMGLPLNRALGFSYIVVYNNNVKRTDPETGRETWEKVPTPTFIPGYKGYIQMALRTGQYKTINADVVYEGELQKVSKLTGEIALDGEKVSDKVVGYFAYIEFINGFSKTLYMSVDEVAAFAKKFSKGLGRNVTAESLAQKAGQPTTTNATGWEGNFDAMAIKTCLRKLLSKYGYLSIEMQSAMSRDIEADDAATAREEAVSQRANSKPIDVEEAEYVDAETGEIVSGGAQQEEDEPQPEY